MTGFDLTTREQFLEVEGGQRRIAIDPAKYVSARLISELADAWLDMTRALDLAYGVRYHYRAAVVGLGQFLKLDEDRRLSLSGQGGQLTERLHVWELNLIRQAAPTSERPRRHGERIRKLVKWHLQQHPTASVKVERWAASTPASGASRKLNPLDELDNRERRQLERACRDIILETEQRLRRGRKLLRSGLDPRTHGWHRLENLLWSMRHLPDSDERRDVLRAAWQAVGHGDLQQLFPADASSTRYALNQAELALAALLFPTGQYLMAIRVLLHLRTGLSPEETKWLKTSHVRFQDQSVAVWAQKQRANRRRWVELETRDSDTWGWKAGDLLKRAEAAMIEARALAPAETAFWVVPKRKDHLRICPETFFTSSFAALITDCGLDISKPHDIRRLRKTVKSVRAAVTGTLAGGAGDDHSVEVFRQHYAQSTTVHVIAARTVMNAQADVFSRLSNGPTFIDAPAASLTDAADISVSHLATQLLDQTPVEAELAATSCRNPYEPPHAEAGQLCHASPTYCLQCPNAVVFTDHLPRLLTFRQVLADLQNSLPPVTFAEMYGQQLENLEAIIAKFSAKEIQRVEADQAVLHLPLAQRVRLT